MQNAVAEASLKRFRCLPKSGKPNSTEWTVLSTIVKDENGSLEVVALGTGSKCIGAIKLSPKGDILNDSHAEVVARRGFLKYLIFEIDQALSGEESIFIADPAKICSLKEGIGFHFFSTHVFCGDAAIMEKGDADEVGKSLLNVKPKRASNEITPDPKRLKIDDIYRTGAKCLQNNPIQDPCGSGSDYHVVGAIRTKPGRGDPTLSVSCSDKMSKWTLLGVQGCILTALIKQPIYFSTITFSKNTKFSTISLERALFARFGNETNLSPPFRQTVPKIGQSDLEFEHPKLPDKRPCPSSISWMKVPPSVVEVTVDGYKQGTTKKTIGTKKSRSRLCKVEIYSDIVRMALKHSLSCVKQTANYREAKKLSEKYNREWTKVKSELFKIWTVKPDNLEDFTADS